MSKRETTDTAVLDRPAEPARPDQPKAVFAVGRGGRGKTVAYRWMIDRGLNRGRQMIVADGDRTNMTLAAFFPGLVADNPATGADEDMRPWLDGLLERAISGQQSLLVDLGGGDQLLKQAALELDLIGLLVQNGMEPVVLHFIGADLDDLAYLREVERGRLLAPEKTAIIFNTGVVPVGVSADAAWQKHERDPVLVAAVDRGAQLIRMPRLGCMTKLDDGRLRFTEASAAKIGLMDAQRVLIWLREMERAFEPIAGWLP